MVAYAGPASQNNITAYFGTSGNCRLRNYNTVRANSDIMRYLNEIINLSAATYASLAKFGPVDAGVGTNIDFIFDDNDAYVSDFSVFTIY